MKHSNQKDLQEADFLAHLNSLRELEHAAETSSEDGDRSERYNKAQQNLVEQLKNMAEQKINAIFVDIKHEQLKNALERLRDFSSWSIRLTELAGVEIMHLLERQLIIKTDAPLSSLNELDRELKIQKKLAFANYSQIIQQSESMTTEKKKAEIDLKWITETYTALGRLKPTIVGSMVLRYQSTSTEPFSGNWQRAINDILSSFPQLNTPDGSSYTEESFKKRPRMNTEQVKAKFHNLKEEHVKVISTAMGDELEAILEEIKTFRQENKKYLNEKSADQLENFILMLSMQNEARFELEKDAMNTPFQLIQPSEEMPKPAAIYGRKGQSDWLVTTKSHLEIIRPAFEKIKSHVINLIEQDDDTTSQRPSSPK